MGNTFYAGDANYVTSHPLRAIAPGRSDGRASFRTPVTEVSSVLPGTASVLDAGVEGESTGTFIWFDGLLCYLAPWRDGGEPPPVRWVCVRKDAHDRRV